MITVVEAARSRNLTTVARVKSSLGLTTSTKDARIAELIEEASDAIVAFCGREFARASVTETLEGNGRTTLMLSYTPIITVSEARLEDEVVESSDYRVSDREAGFMFRSRGWDAKPALLAGIEYAEANMPGEPVWALDYIGGYLVPDDDVTYSGSMSADGTDNSFNVVGDTFPIMVSGEYVTVAGFAAAANNARHRVLARTSTKIIVASTLTAETASGIHTLACSTLPKDIVRYATQEVVSRYKSEMRDDSITMERLGDWQASYRDPSKVPGASDIGSLGLSPRVAEGLTRWVRMA